jgi:RNA polymerase sigma factor (sigma-70 family)
MEVSVPRGPAGGLLAFLRRLPPAPDSDDDLLGRFVRERDGSAFAALVARHGPMVFAVCRRVLGPGADAEDAFQAVFLALVRAAGRIGARAAVPGWLHRVAVRTARKLASRRLTQLPLPPEVGAAHTPDAAQRELLAALDDEIGVLPEGPRAAIVLCGLEGRTNTEAAALLGCPVGTVDSRLSAARRKLRDRLTRRGFELPAIGAALTAISLDTARATADGARLSALVHQILTSGTPSPAVSAILREMTTVRLRFQLFAATIAIAVAAVGGAFALNAAADPPPTPAPPPAAPRAEPAAEPKAEDAEKDYQNALVAAIHRLSESRWDYEHLTPLLKRHPTLVNARVTYKQPRKPLSTDGYTALHFAVCAGNERAVSVLIAAKADVNADAGGGWTPLHFAAQRGDLVVCMMLLKAGAKLDAKTEPVPEHVPPSSPPTRPGEKQLTIPAQPAYTPLDLARKGKHKEVIEYLTDLKR